jgi:hypothetical protein
MASSFAVAPLAGTCPCGSAYRIQVAIFRPRHFGRGGSCSGNDSFEYNGLFELNDKSDPGRNRGLLSLLVVL